ncbi:alkylhydroperoxidase AhpD family core domain protein [Burkholderia pseudomallei MSHR4032]|nr:alkylhydroperoxidase AhpD family core domain protein [Burkholderia pseudomallei MSHR4032]
MALPQSYRELTGEVATQMRALRKTQPDLMSAFAALAAAGTKEGALGKETRELVALGIAIASRCDDCIGFHVQTLVKLGTTREEFEDLSATAVYMGGGPSMMYAAHALRAVEEFGGGVTGGGHVGPFAEAVGLTFNRQFYTKERSSSVDGIASSRELSRAV